MTANFFMKRLSSRKTLSSNIKECSCHCRVKFILVLSRSIVFFFPECLVQITLTALDLADVAITTASSIVIVRKSVT